MKETSYKYYNEKGQEFYDNSVKNDMSYFYKEFLYFIEDGGKILDAGCGSGRDSKYFKEKGYGITAFDASEKMVEKSSKLINEKVLLMRFENAEFNEIFDGIWASASLLHVKKEDMKSVIINLSKYLKYKGVFFMSFKYGNYTFEEDKRYFNCYDEESFENLMKDISELNIYKMYKMGDLRKNRVDEYWLNAYLIKK